MEDKCRVKTLVGKVEYQVTLSFGEGSGQGIRAEVHIFDTQAQAVFFLSQLPPVENPGPESEQRWINRVIRYKEEKKPRLKVKK